MGLKRRLRMYIIFTLTALEANSKKKKLANARLASLLHSLLPSIFQPMPVIVCTWDSQFAQLTSKK